MHQNNPSIMQRAKSWFNLSLFNTPQAGEYFEYLVESIDPMNSLLECKARVIKVITETADTKTWILQPNSRWKGFVAGQHIQVTVEKNGVRTTRTFTISSAPEQWQSEGIISITVKKISDGSVTPWMHETLAEAEIVVISQAAGDFTLPAKVSGRIGYLAAGSGVTPIMSQIRSLAEQGAPIKATLLYFANTGNDFIFESELQALADSNRGFTTHFIASKGGAEGKQLLPQTLLCADHINALLKGKPATIYLCGPHPFRELAKELLAAAGYDLSQVHEEAFGLPPVAAVEGAPVTVNFTESAIEATTDYPGTLLEMAEKVGLKPNAGCRMGICYTCKCTKKSGQVKDIVTGEISSTDEEDIRLCVSTPIGNVDIEL